MAEEKILSIKVVTDTEKTELAALEKQLINTTTRISKLTKVQRDYNKGVKGARQLTNAEAKELGKLKLEAKGVRNRLVDLNNTILKNNSALKKNSGFVAGIKKGIGEWATSMLGLAAVVAAVTKAVNFLINEAKEVNGAIRTSNKLFDESTASIKRTTSQALALASTFDKEVNDVLKAASVLANEFGITSIQATQLIEEGFRKGADANGEFLELLKEYPAQLKTVGLSAEETISIIAQTEQQGIFSDKGIDAIKEAGIRLREFAPATKAAIEGIGLSSDELQKGIENGTISLFEATQKISNRIAELPANSAKVGAAIADVFGGAGEDAGIRFVTGLGKIETKIDELEDKTSKYEEKQLKLNKAWKGFILSIDTGSGTISKVFGGIAEVITNFLNVLTLWNEGEIGFFDTLTSEEIAAKMDARSKRLQEQAEATRKMTKETEDSTKVIDENTDSKNKNADATRKMTKEEEAYWNAIIRARVEQEQAELRFEEQRAENKRSILEKSKEDNKEFLLSELDDLETFYDDEEEIIVKRGQQQADLEIEQQREKNEQLKQEQLAHEQEVANARQQITANLFSSLQTIREEWNRRELQAIERKTEDEIRVLEQKFNRGEITEREYRNQIDNLREKQFEQEKKQAIINNTLNSAVAFMTSAAQYGFTPALGVAGAALGATLIIQNGIVSSQEYQPVEYADGAILKGKSHSQGGIPMTIDGRGGFEAEGGEAIINKRSTSMFTPLLSAINQAGGGVAFDSAPKAKFALGGLVPELPEESFPPSFDASEINRAIRDAVKDIKVINVATETADIANRVANIQEQASF